MQCLPWRFWIREAAGEKGLGPGGTGPYRALQPVHRLTGLRKAGVAGRMKGP